MGEQFLPLNYNKNSQRQHDQHEEEEENDYDYEYEDEALSLCDLALDDSYNDMPIHHAREPSSQDQPSALFQFFTDEFSSEMMTMTTMCSADDVIIKGQLLPFTAEHQQVPVMTKTAQNTAFRKRSNSLPESSSNVKPITTQQETERMMRTSRSMGTHRAHYRPLIMQERSTSVRNGSMVVKRTGSSSSSRSNLCFSMFGPVKLPAEMELKDIKSRQLRRSPSNLMPPPVPDRNTAGGGGGSGGSWKFLKALSCKDPRSVGVAASFNS